MSSFQYFALTVLTGLDTNFKKTYVVLWPWGPLNDAHGRGAHGFSAVEGKGGDVDRMEDGEGFSDGNASNMELPQPMVEMEVW